MNHRYNGRFLNPRTLTGGNFGYVYRRHSPIGMTEPPSLGMTSKLANKEGIIFASAPDFWNLDANGDKIQHGAYGGMTQDDLDEFAKEEEEKEQEKKRKRKKKPTVPQVRSVLRKIIKYHESKHREAMQSFYPPIQELVEKNNYSTAGGGKSHKKESEYNRPVPTHDGSKMKRKDRPAFGKSIPPSKKKKK